MSDPQSIVVNASNTNPAFQSASIREIFENRSREAVDPALVQKIQAAFLALEDALRQGFPNSKRLNQVLSYIEIAAMFAVQLLVR